jgi:hypothetical protein
MTASTRKMSWTSISSKGKEPGATWNNFLPPLWLESLKIAALVMVGFELLVMVGTTVWIYLSPV